MVPTVMSECTVCGDSECFEVRVSVHRDLALSLLFVIVMEAMSGEFRVALPWDCCVLITWL